MYICLQCKIQGRIEVGCARLSYAVSLTPNLHSAVRCDMHLFVARCWCGANGLCFPRLFED
ncbi:hypothetical protein E2C01_072906 [Portunus trituberculatus]|uniref:Uncharacterized protein n=1 Tax=Portunus trituberculatus TaxID=210409 RepID=A0A5B7I1C3_PORTR|nr:hypothetical protein [Portunus trituberculatus]